MIEWKAKKVLGKTVRVEGEMYARMLDLQERERQLTGKRPTLISLLERAWNAYISDAGPGTTYVNFLHKETVKTDIKHQRTGKWKTAFSQLESIEESGDPDVADAIQSNLKIFSRYIKPGEPHVVNPSVPPSGPGLHEKVSGAVKSADRTDRIVEEAQAEAKHVAEKHRRNRAHPGGGKPRDKSRGGAAGSGSGG